MCGILFSNDSKDLGSLEMLERRGPEAKHIVTNELGYFFHSNLNTIGDTTAQPLTGTKGILLYNGSTYGMKGNDAAWLSNQLDNSHSHSIEVIQSLRGEYALIYVTDTHVIFCSDQFYQRNLWFYHSKKNKEITISSIPSNIISKHGAAWRCDENKIYSLDKSDFSIECLTNKVWDLTQYKNNFDTVFEKFEEAVMYRHDTTNATNLQSSGMDSGVINAATNKLLGSEFSSVCDVGLECKDTLAKRNLIHRTYPVLYKGVQPEKNHLETIMPNTDIWDRTELDPVLNILRDYVTVKKKHKVLITGNGGDEIYNDWQDQTDGKRKRLGKSCGRWPEDMQLIWPYHNYYPRLIKTNTVIDFACGYYGVEVRNPMLDCEVVQAWLNTTADLKNSKYKGWMQEYMRIVGYPFTKQKIHFNEG